VIDERMDLELLQRTAALRPDWSFVLIGPVVKIDPAFIPRRANIHLLGPKPYDELPMYISGWDVAMMPFARNEATRFISPTKTLEYLAAGRAVVSTSIRDVTSPYGEQGLVAIADDPDAFVAAIDRALVEDPVSRQERADAWLAGLSWDATWARMRQLIEVAERARMPAAEEGPATHGVLTNGRSWTRDVRTAAEAAQQ
jgi:UDP-galactopyranose mutase